MANVGPLGQSMDPKRIYLSHMTFPIIHQLPGGTSRQLASMMCLALGPTPLDSSELRGDLSWDSEELGCGGVQLGFVDRQSSLSGPANQKDFMGHFDDTYGTAGHMLGKHAFMKSNINKKLIKICYNMIKYN